MHLKIIRHAMQQKLISEVEKNCGVSRRIAQDHLLHGISLGFLERIASSGGILRPEAKSKKIDETAKSLFLQ